jgi:hypothetical protein
VKALGRVIGADRFRVWGGIESASLGRFRGEDCRSRVPILWGETWSYGKGRIKNYS